MPESRRPDSGIYPKDKKQSARQNAETQTALPLDWILNPIKGRSLSERVLARLLQSEARETDTYFRRDINIAWLIVLHCMKGDAVECSPVTLSYYQAVGCHEDQYYDRLMIRRAAMFANLKRVKPSPLPFPQEKEKSA